MAIIDIILKWNNKALMSSDGIFLALYVYVFGFGAVFQEDWDVWNTTLHGMHKLHAQQAILPCFIRSDCIVIVQTIHLIQTFVDVYTAQQYHSEPLFFQL